MTPEERIRTHLEFLYGPETAAGTWPRLHAKLHTFRQAHPHFEAAAPPALPLSEQDAVLITYADQFRRPGQAPLHTLGDFLDAHLAGAVNAVHLLPFFPYSSDDGFSVIDYHQVDPRVGSWPDVARLGTKYRLMFDAVINHISSRSEWFQAYLRQEAPYRGYFIEVPPDTDLSKVVRPRALPLLTPVETAAGGRHVWTTFSDDQIDLNYANPEVLLAIIDVLLRYVSMGAEIIRLDAIAYLWKEVGTPCIHLPQTHAVIKLWRAALDAVAPHVILLTETNVPHEENISYFGQGGDEAQMVYQFPLAPLVLHTFLTGDAGKLTAWAAGLEVPSERTAFFNFIASHDGLGVRPAEGILTAGELDALVERTQAHGGRVSYKNNPDGSRSVYELNITLYDFLNPSEEADTDTGISRFLASQAIMLSLAGVPGIYVHSLFGSRNCQAYVEETGRARSINREKFDLDDLEAALRRPGSRSGRVLAGYRRLLEARRRLPGLHPASLQRVLALHPGVFAVLRGDRSPVLCLANVTGAAASLSLELGTQKLEAHTAWENRLSGQRFRAAGGVLALALAPYESAWLCPVPAANEITQV